MDISDIIKNAVYRSVTSPNYSVLLEEATRNERQVLGSSSSMSRNDDLAALCSSSNSDRRTSLLMLSSGAMTRRLHEDDVRLRPSKVTIIGANGYLGKFVVEECIKKKLDVDIVSRDVGRSQRIFDPIFDGTVERRRKESLGYVVATKPVPNVEKKSCDEITEKDVTHSRRPSNAPTCRYFDADVTNDSDDETIRNAIHGSSIVFYFASARRERWLQWNHLKSVDVEGLKRCMAHCHEEDAHLVILSPLVAWASRWLPGYLWYNYGAFKRGNLRIARMRERLFLKDDGSLSEYYVAHTPGLRFTIFRTNQLVYPAFQKTTLIAKNNNVQGRRSFIDITQYTGNGFLTGGDLCARTFSNMLLRCLCFHRSCENNRIDVGGTMNTRVKGGLPIGASLSDVDFALQGLRHEECQW